MSEILLAYDGANRLTLVYRRDRDEDRWQRLSSIDYDFLGRKTSMSDADLGSWSYAYNTLGQLTRQTDARARTGCLYYDSLGRMRGRVQRTDENCAATVAGADLDSSYVYDSQGRMQSESNDNVSCRLGLTAYFDFYSHERPHQSLNYRTPADEHFVLCSEPAAFA
ncbi:MAG: integrase core domain-containing protein [Caldilineaceae bacterium]|nr:integrase core domain-containing protein [Caldilineaceae bacterium]